LIAPQAASEFERYLKQAPLVVERSSDFNPLKWWDDHKAEFPTLYLDAWDTLPIPAMSAECERVFSSAKIMLTPERNALKEDIIEAAECLRAWWKDDFISQR
jgi:hAT family C-terminal dimerisation region